VGKIHHQLVNLLGLSRTVISPIDDFVDDHSILQPDVLVLPENRPIRQGDREVAAPIMVVEVLSPSREARDRDQKVAIYLRGGAAEWAGVT